MESNGNSERDEIASSSQTKKNETDNAWESLIQQMTGLASSMDTIPNIVKIKDAPNSVKVDDTPNSVKMDNQIWEYPSREMDDTPKSPKSPNSFDTSALFSGRPTELHLKNENVCYVISNRFENRPIGEGNFKQHYAIDEENIDRTFKSLNFEVKTKRNLSVGNMKRFIREITQQDFSDRQCLALFILSHGKEGGLIQGNDSVGNAMSDYLQIDWIINELQSVQTLIGKPKLIFVQVCRGSKVMEIVEVKENQNGIQDAGVVKKAKKADTLVYYATMNDNVASTNATIGSLFIFALCGTLMNFYTTPTSYHLGDVVTKVNDFLSTCVRKLAMREGEVECVQVSEACSSLTQNIYFYPKENAGLE